MTTALLAILLETETRFLFRSDKIFAVLTVVLLIWAGILAFLWLTERRVRRLEERLRQGPPGA